MKLVKKNNKYFVLDSMNRVAKLYVDLDNRLDTIFLRENGLKTSTKEVIEPYECEVIIEDNQFGIRKFKDLKHRVAAYLIVNGIQSSIPTAYRNAYKANKHLYDKGFIL